MKPMLRFGAQVTKDEHNVMHVRTAIIPDPDADEAQLELQQLDAGQGRRSRGRRMIGKQSDDPHPLQGALPLLFEQRLAEHAGPALLKTRAGGGITEEKINSESNSELNSRSTSRGGAFSSTTSSSSGSNCSLVECSGCGLKQPFRYGACRDYEFVDGAAVKSLAVVQNEQLPEGIEASDDEPVTVEFEVSPNARVTEGLEASGDDEESEEESPQTCDFCGEHLWPEVQGGSAVPGEHIEPTQRCSWRDAELFHDAEVREHWALKKIYLEELRKVAVGEEEGREQGRSLEELEEILRLREDHLKEQHDQLHLHRLAALSAPPMSTDDPAMFFLNQKKARIVVCGNRLEKVSTGGSGELGSEEKNQGDPYSTYAGGADGTLLRCLVRKASVEDWCIASLDVATAFLLAPRQSSARQLLVMRPPKVLIEAGLCGEDELWRIQNAMYGLQESPADWSVYRNGALARIQWEVAGTKMLLRTPEPNLWKMVIAEGDAALEKEGAKDQVLGFVALYVDDVMCVGEEPAVQGFLDVIQRTWKCSTPEDVIGRYKDLVPKSVPLLASLDETPEEDFQLADVRAAQAVVGTRPDLSYSVAWMGRNVMR
eukprot:s3183_g7.t1